MVSMKPIGADKNGGGRGDSLVSGWLCVYACVCARVHVHVIRKKITVTDA